MIQGIVARFREKGATSPEKAVTAQELGLPPRFEEAMKRRLGATGIFVDVGGRYYLDEARLKQVQEERRAGGGMAGGRGQRGSVLAIRMARMAVGLVAVVLALSNILFVRSAYLSFTVVALVIVWVVLTVFQLFFLSRARSRWRASEAAAGPP
ncbi:MAG: hypothetical protein OK442_02165 [Thaumarchaeota archaeon]|nr:hypothetical protein [Nitrososphaerota archaeon]